MSRTNQNIAIGRSALGTAFGFIGIIGLLFAIVSFAWYLRFSPVVIVSLIVGLVSFVSWAVIAPKDFVATLTGRQARHGTTSVITSMLLLGIIVLTYIIIARANLAVDATLGREFSLSDASFDVLRRIPSERTVQITGFYSARALDARTLDDQFLRQYEIESDGRVVVEYINPAQQPALAQRFGAVRDGDLFVSLLDDEGNIDFDTLTYVPRENKQERDVTSAIQRMLNERVFKVYFLESRGTLSPNDGSGEGLTLLESTLLLNGIEVEFISLAALATNGTPIPGDAAVIVLPRPVFALTQPETDAIANYLADGGGLLVLADTTFTENESFLIEDTPFSDYLSGTYGLSAGTSVLVDPPMQLDTPLDIIAAATYLEHPVGERVQATGESTFFRLARPVAASTEKPPSVGNGRIMSTSPQSYAETNLEAIINSNTYKFDPGEDRQGPFDLVVWAQDVIQNGGNGSRVVLIGDGNIAMDRNFDAGTQGNAALLLESIVWLADIDDNNVEFSFAANPSAIPTIFVSGRQLDIIGIVIVVIIPLTVLLTGVIVWYRRVFA